MTLNTHRHRGVAEYLFSKPMSKLAYDEYMGGSREGLAAPPRKNKAEALCELCDHDVTVVLD